MGQSELVATENEQSVMSVLGVSVFVAKSLLYKTNGDIAEALNKYFLMTSKEISLLKDVVTTNAVNGDSRHEETDGKVPVAPDEVIVEATTTIYGNNLIQPPCVPIGANTKNEISDEDIQALADILAVDITVSTRILAKYGGDVTEAVTRYCGLSTREQEEFTSVSEQMKSLPALQAVSPGKYVISAAEPDCECIITMDKYYRHEGFCCDNGHFICWDSFNDYVESASAPGAIFSSCDADGQLLCPDPKCKVPFDLRKVAAAEGGPVTIFDTLLDLKFKVQAAKVVKEAEEVQRLKLNAEFEAIQKISDLDERAAHVLRREIIDEILTLRCPRKNCRLAFIDFDNCFAVTCSSKTCKCGFCAWCLADCGDDAHPHVLTCPESQQAGYYSTVEKFNAHHTKRHKTRIEALCKDKNAEVKKFLRVLMKSQFQELGVVI